jgi:hypothetical protein
MVGPEGLPLAIVWLQVLVWPHWSVASHVRVATKPFPQARLVTVLRTLMVAVPHVSLPLGGSKTRLLTPDVFVLLAEQVMMGGVVSTVAIVWLQVFVLPELSVASQVRVAENVLPQPALVTVLKMETLTDPHVSLAFGSSKARVPTPHSLVLFPEQVIEGRVVSTKAIVWLQVLELPHASVAAQVRVATNVLPPVMFVSVPTIEIVAVPHVSLAVGSSKLKVPTPHSLVLFGAQVMEGAVVSMLAMVWLQVFVFPELSVATHVRVARKVLPQPRLVDVPKIETVAAPHVSVALG